FAAGSNWAGLGSTHAPVSIQTTPSLPESLSDLIHTWQSLATGSHLPAGWLTAAAAILQRLTSHCHHNPPPTATTASLSGTVFSDANTNGVQEAGEEGLTGVTITLTGTSTNGTAVSLTTTTDPNGNYS